MHTEIPAMAQMQRAQDDRVREDKLKSFDLLWVLDSHARSDAAARSGTVRQGSACAERLRP